MEMKGIRVLRSLFENWVGQFERHRNRVGAPKMVLIKENDTCGELTLFRGSHPKRAMRRT